MANNEKTNEHKIEDFEKPDKKPDSQPGGDKQPPNLRPLFPPPPPLQPMQPPQPPTPPEEPIYEDEFLRYDEVRQMYYLTERAMQEIKDFRGEGYQEADIMQISRRVSRLIYDLIYSNPIRAKYNEELIKRCDGAREQFKRALMEQAEYMTFVGDLSFSANEADRKRVIAPAVRNILSQPFNFLYAGV